MGGSAPGVTLAAGRIAYAQAPPYVRLGATENCRLRPWGCAWGWLHTRCRTPSSTGALEGACGPGWEEAAGSSSLLPSRIPRDPRASYPLHPELCMSISEHLGGPPRRWLPCPRTSGPAAAPRISPVPSAYPCPVLPDHLPADRRPQPRTTLRGGRPLLRLFFRLRPRSPELRQLRKTEPP